VKITADGFIIREGVHRGIRWTIDGKSLTFEDGRTIKLPVATAKCKACSGHHWCHSCQRHEELTRYFDKLIATPIKPTTWSPYTEAPAP
jgi:hypothetical protein